MMCLSGDAVNVMPVFFKGTRQGRNWQSQILQQVRGKQKIVNKWTNQSILEPGEKHHNTNTSLTTNS